MNPSTDIIEVLGGLDSIDRLVSDLVNSLDSIIRQSPNLALRSKAVTTATVMVAGAFQTSLISYFIHRDLFPALMKYVHDAPGSAHEPYILLGCLASYQKFESQNLYQDRLEDFVDEATIRLLLSSFSDSCRSIRESYTAVQDDEAASLTLSSALSYVGLRSLSPDARKPPPPNEDEAKVLFNALPSSLACSMLSTYTFVHANKVFASAILTKPSDPQIQASESPLSTFLSCTSYLAHHAHRSPRCVAYATLNLLTLRLLLEDPLTAKPICHPSSHAVSVRLARQRAPFLPSATTSRPPAAAILDISIDTLSHNLRRRLDISLYSAALSLILRILTTLSTTGTRLPYHWSYLWGALLSLVKFATSYADDLRFLRGMKEEVCTPLADVLAFALVRGDAFLPGEGDYDDLFYKLLEAHELLPNFRSAYVSGATGKENTKKEPLEKATNALVKVSGHFHSAVGEKGLVRGRKHQSASEVKRVVKEGYETLDLAGVANDGPGDGGFGRWETWREGERKAEVKRLMRVAVEDARVLGMREQT